MQLILKEVICNCCFNCKYFSFTKQAFYKEVPVISASAYTCLHPEHNEYIYSNHFISTNIRSVVCDDWMLRT